MRDGLDEDLGIEPQRPAVDVGKIELHPAIEVQPAAALQRPQAGHPWTHAQPPTLPRFVFFHFLRHGRPRANKRHITAQDVPQLRQLVHAGAAQPAAHWRAARIIGNLEHWPIHFVQVLDLRTQ